MVPDIYNMLITNYDGFVFYFTDTISLVNQILYGILLFNY